jgi:hypothetical protein
MQRELGRGEEEESKNFGWNSGVTFGVVPSDAARR